MTKPSKLFDVMFQLYNLASTIPDEVSQVKRIASLSPDILANYKEAFTGTRTFDDSGENRTVPTKRTRGGHGGKGGNTGNGLQHSEEVYHDREVVDAFTRAGYTLESNDEDENGWTPLNQVNQPKHTVC